MRATTRVWIVQETEKAYLFSKLPKGRGGAQIWFPKSMVECLTKLYCPPGDWRECELGADENFLDSKGLL